MGVSKCLPSKGSIDTPTECQPLSIKHREKTLWRTGPLEDRHGHATWHCYPELSTALHALHCQT